MVYSALFNGVTVKKKKNFSFSACNTCHLAWVVRIQKCLHIQVHNDKKKRRKNQNVTFAGCTQRIAPPSKTGAYTSVYTSRVQKQFQHAKTRDADRSPMYSLSQPTRRTELNEELTLVSMHKHTYKKKKEKRQNSQLSFLSSSRNAWWIEKKKERRIETEVLTKNIGWREKKTGKSVLSMTFGPVVALICSSTGTPPSLTT